MKNFSLFILLFTFILPNCFSQNYLRTSFPAWWNNDTSVPNWHENWDEGVFDEIDIITSPQGIYTRYDVYATMTHNEEVWGWDDFLEIVWQFDLPDNAIIYDSWLWVGNDIIKADVVDYWSALQTYTEIVNIQQDPSFLYQMEDNRYEIRIYPCLVGESRKIKLSFLIPTDWSSTKTTTNLVNHIFVSTSPQYLPEFIGIGMLEDPNWTSPEIQFNNQTIPLTSINTTSSGESVYYTQVPSTEFVSADYPAYLSLDAPLSNEGSFLTTYEDQGDKFYQLAYVPGWEYESPPTINHSLILVDLNSNGVSLTNSYFNQTIIQKLNDYDADLHYFNIAVNGPNGVEYLFDSWELYTETTDPQMILDFIWSDDDDDVIGLLNNGFNWINNAHLETDNVYFFVANNDINELEDMELYAEAIGQNAPTNTSISIFNVNDIGITNTIGINGNTYWGNEYLYHLLSVQNSQITNYTYRTTNMDYWDWLNPFLPTIVTDHPFVTSDVTMSNGISFDKYDIHDADMGVNSNGIILQTGKYIGELPLQINAAIIYPNSSFEISNNEIEMTQNIDGDSLMREMWYGSYLKIEEANASSEDEIEAVITQSIAERVLTGVTAFLALEPNQGGEPCIDCFSDVPEIVNTDEEIDITSITIFPNPVTDYAQIELTTNNFGNLSDWNAEIFDATGRLIRVLNTPVATKSTLTWQWNLAAKTNAGIYHCKITNGKESFSRKVVVMR